MNTEIAMPQYRCHKVVRALQIGGISPKPNPDQTGLSASVSYGAVLLPSDPRYAPFEVPAEYMTKHQPDVGGYYVVYEDGYASFSPAKAFEDGYSPIEDIEVPSISWWARLLPHQKRVVAEKARLDADLEKLRAFCRRRGDVYDSLPDSEQKRLMEQLGHMTNYSRVLGERIAAF